MEGKNRLYFNSHHCAPVDRHGKLRYASFSEIKFQPTEEEH